MATVITAAEYPFPHTSARQIKILPLSARKPKNHLQPVLQDN